MIAEILTFLRRHWWHLVLLIPGAILVTMVHEAAHAVAVLVQGGTVREFVWLPGTGSWGHVAYDFPPGARYSRAAIALAPATVWFALATGACLLCRRERPFTYVGASLVFFWLFVIPLADIAHAAFPFLAGEENDFASAFGQAGAVSAIGLGIATVAAWIGGHFVQRRLYGADALSGAAYAVLSTAGLLDILFVTVELGI